MIFVPSFASHGKIFSPSPFAFSWIPYIFGMDGPVISASMIPTENPCSLISLASDAVTIDFPTPPFPLTTAITWLMCDFLFSGLIRLCGLLPHSPAWEQPAQSDGLQPVFVLLPFVLLLYSRNKFYFTQNSFGSVFTATQLLAGFDVKYFPYTSLNAAKSLISARKHVVFNTLSNDVPASFKTSLSSCIPALSVLQL